ncbi:MAG: glucose-6-phosphate dehydrogenase [Bacteroidia bacterium]|nr:glucose-6-phosphate dehydrogenase [Bacteroidia bacterium]
MNSTANQILVIFGASGDLTNRKLIPALYDLYCQEMLPENFAVLGVSRSEYSDESFREKILPGIKEFANKKASQEEKVQDFLDCIFYQSIDTQSVDDYGTLKTRLEEINARCKTDGNYIFYLSTPPSLYSVIPSLLAAHGLHKEGKGIFRRLIIEKPFGYDLASAKTLNKDLLKHFREHQIYRIDHYLGKETVQNLLVTRFSNGIFEPLWNSKYIHHVQITSAESIGVGDRGGYYDGSGALRDMLQNHLLQIVGMVAMEPPSVIEATSIRNETLKVFQSFRPITEEEVKDYVIRGQYTESTVRGEHMKGYRQEKGVPDESRTPTFVAMKFFIDNWRWGGVPFYIRTGKRLPTRATEIVIQFKETPHRLFKDVNGAKKANQLVIRIQPNEGVKLKFGMKVPGAGFQVENVDMDFHYSDLQNTYVPSAYERLLLDAMLGDATLYARGDAVEEAWEFVDPILKAWATRDDIPVYGYPAGTWGPEPVDSMIEGENMNWRYPCKNLADDGNYCEL